MITGVDVVTLPASDMARAAAFYRDILGLQTSSPPSDRNLEFAIGAQTPCLMRLEVLGMPFQPAASVMLSLAVADVDQAVADLLAKGLPFAQPVMDTGVCKMAFGHDPEGNALMLHRRYAAESLN
ncbi:MAG: VOC family protein [Candidatus Sericytochromatia bacterium]|nr:VOC family protein [Candidatus Sericytochromatia bacterium]